MNIYKNDFSNDYILSSLIQIHEFNKNVILLTSKIDALLK